MLFGMMSASSFLLVFVQTPNLFFFSPPVLLKKEGEKKKPHFLLRSRGTFAIAIAK